MTLITYFRLHEWEWKPGHAPLTDIHAMSEDEQEQIVLRWHAYLNNPPKHHVVLDLLPEEWDKLDDMAQYYGLSRSKLLEQFVKDLCGYRHTGSDERDLANAWYDRNLSKYAWQADNKMEDDK